VLIYKVSEDIQGDSGEKINTLGGDSTVSCEKNFNVSMCIILNGCRNRAVLIYKYKSVVKVNNEDTLVTVNLL
jgi:hypothetical protein